MPKSLIFGFKNYVKRRGSSVWAPPRAKGCCFLLFFRFSFFFLNMLGSG